jgi:hypothetical protein
MPDNIAALLPLLNTMLIYGRHLLNSLEQRAVARGFSTIAQNFGTAHLPTMLGSIRRGIMRAIALERVLRLRGMRGRDIVPRRPQVTVWDTSGASGDDPGDSDPGDSDLGAGFSEAMLRGDIADPWQPKGQHDPRHDASQHGQAQHGQAQHGQAQHDAGQQQAGRRAAAQPRTPLEAADPATIEDYMAEARRKPVGWMMAAICRDLGISPGLCESRFWTAVMCAMMDYRGNVGSFMLELRRNERTFERELDRRPSLGWPEQAREAVRAILGFFIGETPELPAYVLAVAPVASHVPLMPERRRPP